MDLKYKPNVGEIIWQYTSKGKVNGISGNVDMDIMYGQLKPDTPKPTPGPTPSPTPTPSPVEKLVKVIVNSINRRATASIQNDNIVGWYKLGNIVQVVGKTNDGNWYIDTEGRYFTSNSKYVIDLTGYVNCHSLNVRDQNNATTGKIITTIFNGIQLTLLKLVNGWYYARLPNGIQGWVSSKYITQN